MLVTFLSHLKIHFILGYSTWAVSLVWMRIWTHTMFLSPKEWRQHISFRYTQRSWVFSDWGFSEIWYATNISASTNLEMQFLSILLSINSSPPRLLAKHSIIVILKKVYLLNFSVSYTNKRKNFVCVCVCRRWLEKYKTRLKISIRTVQGNASETPIFPVVVINRNIIAKLQWASQKCVKSHSDAAEDQFRR